MYSKMKLLWNEYREMIYKIGGCILLLVYCILALFGYDNKNLIIARVVVSILAGVCFFLIIIEENKGRGNLGLTVNHFVLTCTIFWAIFNGIMLFIK